MFWNKTGKKEPKGSFFISPIQSLLWETASICTSLRGNDLLHFLEGVVLLDCCLVEVVSLAVDHDDDRKIFYLDLADCLRSEILITYNLGFCDAFGKQCAGSADGCKIDGVVADHCVYDFF